MISKETFCKAMRLRDKHFHRDCQLSQFFEDFEIAGDLFSCACHDLYDAFNLLLPEILGATPSFYSESLGLEWYAEDDEFRFEVDQSDGTKRLIRSYEELYDYLTKEVNGK